MEQKKCCVKLYVRAPVQQCILLRMANFFPVFRSENGSNTGTAYFDNISLVMGNSRENLLENGGFETDIENIDVTCDFTRFDTGMHKFLDEFGFRDFRLELARIASPFGGFQPGSPEHDKLFSSSVAHR